MVYVGFSTTNKLVSRIIRWVTRAEVSHTFLIVELYGQPWAAGAEFSGLELIPIKKFQLNNQIKAVCKLPELDDGRLAKVMDAMGDAYDLGGLLGGIFPQIGKWFKQKWRNPWGNPKAMICSEFVTLALQECEIPGASDLDPTAVTPQDLKDFLLEYNLNRDYRNRDHLNQEP